MVVSVASSFAFGVPQSTEVQWMFEDAIKRVMPASEARVVATLDKLDEIECTLYRSSQELFAKRAGELEANLDQPDMVEKEYARWATRLADMLGVIPYPYSARFQSLTTPRAGNISVRR